MKNRHGMLVVVDFVDNPVVADPDAPSFPGGQLQATWWSRVFPQGADCVTGTRVRFRGKLCQFLLGPPQNEEGVIHF